jgi:hypothetical protein
MDTGFKVANCDLEERAGQHRKYLVHPAVD